MQLRFAKAHHQIKLEKSGCGPWLGELPEIWGVPFNISATDVASDFTFGTQLGFAKAHHKIAPRGKSGGVLELGKLPYILGSRLIFLQRPRCPLSVSGASCSEYCDCMETRQVARLWQKPRDAGFVFD